MAQQEQHQTPYEKATDAFLNAKSDAKQRQIANIAIILWWLFCWVAITLPIPLADMFVGMALDLPAALLKCPTWQIAAFYTACGAVYYFNNLRWIAIRKAQAKHWHH